MIDLRQTISGLSSLPIIQENKERQLTSERRVEEEKAYIVASWACKEVLETTFKGIKKF